jgi:hypothetical protein
MAVGDYYLDRNSPDMTLVESWDGSRWAVVPSPNAPPASGSSYFNSVSCAPQRSCTAVGNYAAGSGPWKTLVESWDGARWSVVPSPDTVVASASEGSNAGSVGDELNAVSCASGVSCTAVGFSQEPNKISVIDKTLVESWDGTKWSVVGGPVAGFLFGVSCVSADTCTAVGTAMKKALIETS